MHKFNQLKSVIFVALLMGPAHSFADQLQLTVPDLAQKGFTNQFIFNQFGCNGDNLSPQINWQNVPSEAKSLVLSVYDPDAPTGSGWWHWVVVNIPTTATTLVQSAGNNPQLLPSGSQAIRNDFGVSHYGGPCPPEKSDHRYQFTLYALDVDHIDVNEQTTPAMVGFIANFHQVAKASVTYHYSR